jgi:hypothetical protein
MTVRGGGDPMDSMAYHAVTENGSPAASELRNRCVLLHHGSGPWTHRIQGCGAIDPRSNASSPLIVILLIARLHSMVPPCSELSRPKPCGWSPKRRPALTAPARDGLPLWRVGTKKRAFRSNKETKEERWEDGPCWLKLLDKKSPIQGVQLLLYISSNGEGNRSVGSLEVKAPAGRAYRSDPYRGASNLAGRSKCVNREAPKDVPRVKRIAGTLGVPSRSDLGEGDVGIEVLD